MTHLTVAEIMKFISFDELNEENMKLASKVNKHIIDCPACRNKISGIQKTIDRMMDFDNKADFEIDNLVIDEDIKKAVADFFDFK